MLKSFAVAFATFFATIGPLDLAALFAALTPYYSETERRAAAFKGTLIAAVILLVFAFFGTALLDYLGISLAALRISGGVLLLLFAVDMVFGGGGGGGARSSDEEKMEAMQKSDLSVFPLAMPLIAGPATIGATVLLMADAGGDLVRQTSVIAALLAVLLLTLLFLMVSGQVRKLLGVTGLHVISRTVGIILSALAVQFMIDGLRESGLFTAA
ncbi:MAG: MarC family protein [Chlorobi bacterium]|nr:MarC family protein [Chlorobiota bacterium]